MVGIGFSCLGEKVMSVLAVIPARGGSKGIPRKNVRLLAGKPLIAYSVEAAQHSAAISRLICSTDDNEIADVARSLGVEVPFMRPNHLASDAAGQLEVVLHAVHTVETLDNIVYDVILLLQPTAPLRTAEDIDTALALFDEETDSVISFNRVERDHPYYMYKIEEDNRPVPLIKRAKHLTRRQQFPTIYVRNGAIYATRRNVLLAQNSFYGDCTRAYIMPPARSINIDSELDLKYAEFLLTNSEDGRL